MFGDRFFGLVSLIAGTTSSTAVLIICRLFQGIGCAAIIPSSLALISHAFPPEEKGKAVGIWSGITAIGTVLGPVVGGILVSSVGWRWIFFINIPFVAASLLLSFRYVKESKNTTSEKKIDPLGFSLLTIGISALVIGLMHTLDWGWTSPYTLLCFFLALAALVWFYHSENKCPYPIIPFSAFSNRTFFSCVAVLFCMFFIIVPSFFLIPLYLQVVRGEPAYIAGLMLLPITGLLALFSPILGNWFDIFSPKNLILAGLLCLFIIAVLQSFFQVDTSPVIILISLSFMGLGWAFGRNPATTQGLTALPMHLSGAATGVVWTFLNLGSSLGLAIAGTVFRAFYEPSKTDASFMLGYHWATLILAAMGAFIFLFIAIWREEPLPKK